MMSLDNNNEKSKNKPIKKNQRTLNPSRER